MRDNLLTSTNSLRSSLSAFKKKLSNVKISLEELDSSLENLDLKIDRLIASSEIYKAKLKREMGIEVKLLEREVKELRKLIPAEVTREEVTNEEVLKIAKTMTIFESILMHICENAADFRLASCSFLFPAVFERVVRGDEEAYFLNELPSSCTEVIRRGRDYVTWVRSECGTHITDPEAWEQVQESVCDWWRNDALPLIYGSRDEQWDIDEPLTLTEMLTWQDNPGDRPIHFGPVFDAYEIYKKHKDEVYESSGVKEFDIKMFTKSN